MKMLTTLVSLSAVATGAVGAAIAYASTAPEPAPAVSTPEPAAKPAARIEPGVRLEVRLRPCRPGAELEHGKCVRRVTRTVVLGATAAPQPAPAVDTLESASTGAAAGADDERREDRARRARGGHQHEAREPEDHGSEDRETEDRETERHETEDHETESHDSEDHEPDDG